MSETFDDKQFHDMEEHRPYYPNVSQSYFPSPLQSNELFKKRNQSFYEPKLIAPNIFHTPGKITKQENRRYLNPPINYLNPQQSDSFPKKKFIELNYVNDAGFTPVRYQLDNKLLTTMRNTPVPEKIRDPVEYLKYIIRSEALEEKIQKSRREVKDKNIVSVPLSQNSVYGHIQFPQVNNNSSVDISKFSAPRLKKLSQSTIQVKSDIRKEFQRRLEDQAVFKTRDIFVSKKIEMSPTNKDKARKTTWKMTENDHALQNHHEKSTTRTTLKTEYCVKKVIPEIPINMKVNRSQSVQSNQPNGLKNAKMIVKRAQVKKMLV